MATVKQSKFGGIVVFLIFVEMITLMLAFEYKC